ncbi:alpha-1,4-glucan--maltose-1-phosphate maltosyltransferase [Terracidiphilus gabretensis]|uniref:alpha-1,4-glucan--maltose-1-phosphate maltosyltransferase n=1 Tax=Terracidiphilus gabretensis TaxID=1577687 RepID=UPI00071BA9BD|nr:alpha-1,4-glucan--maltose-1-phosphate maltosyltransferase [Terracidiphilus gabretensis]
MKAVHGRKRVVIEDVDPQIDAGLYPVRRILGDVVNVTAAIFADGKDELAARLLYRHSSDSRWRLAPMLANGNDLWSSTFQVDKLGAWRFTLQGWVDHFATWAKDFKKRLAAQNAPDPTSAPADAASTAAADSGSGIEIGSNPAAQDVALALSTGAQLVHEAANRARRNDAKRLREIAANFEKLAEEKRSTYDDPCDEALMELMARYPDLANASELETELRIWVDRERAQFSTWYELFPRSASPVPGQHGTFRDVEKQLPEIAAMGFDILYMPPIHPIGRAFRKGPNNATEAPPEALGSPWAIGDREVEVSAPASASKKAGKKVSEDQGGHKSIHPQLGTFADFESVVNSAKQHGMEIALDIAFQCSPDHPWVMAHPDWFIIRPDGSIQYAENPPKKYQDIYPLNFESSDWRALWDELYSVFEFWIQRSVHVFRVDNPHTKSLLFWEWCLDKLRSKYPETIFLAEAFTRPHVMYSLAKRGFTQSYTYFTWRNTKPELESYLEEITQPPISDFFGPNFWPNTPDILHKTLQEGGRSAFMHRVILAATLTANYGIYGPAYELAESAPARPAPGKTESEEYLDSEKYEIRQRDRNAPDSLVPLISKLNQIRHENRALQSNTSLHFHTVDNPQMICYSKTTPDFENTILVVVNLDSTNEQIGWASLDLDKIGCSPNESFLVDDLLNGAQYTWGNHNYVALQPGTKPAHIFRVKRLS